MEKDPMLTSAHFKSGSVPVIERNGNINQMHEFTSLLVKTSVDQYEKSKKKGTKIVDSLI